MNKFDKAIDKLCQGMAAIESSNSPELSWLKSEFIEMLQERTNRTELRLDYEQEREEEILNPWLREMTLQYFDD